MARIDLKQTEGAKATDRPSGIRDFTGSAFAGLSAMERANDNLARGIKHVSDSFYRITMDMADTRNQQDNLAGQTAYYEIQEENNKKILEQINAGDFDGKNGDELFKEACAKSQNLNNEKFQKWCDENVHADKIRDFLTLQSKKDDARNYAHLTGAMAKHAVHRTRVVAEDGIALAVKNMNPGQVDQWLSTLGDQKDSEGNVVKKGVESPELIEMRRREAYKAILRNEFSDEVLRISATYVGQEASDAYFALAQEVISGKFDKLGSREIGHMIAMLSKASQGAISFAAEEQKLNGTAEIAMEKAIALRSEGRKEIEANFDSLIKNIRSSDAFSPSEKEDEINKALNARKQCLENFQTKMKEAEIQADEEVKTDLLGILDEAIKSTNAVATIPEGKERYNGLFTSRIGAMSLDEEGKFSTKIEQQNAFKNISMRIAATDFKKGDGKGMEAMEIARLAYAAIDDPEMRRSLMGKLAYKLGDDKYKNYYGGIEKGTMEATLKVMFPSAMGADRDDPIYAAFLDEARERFGVYGSDGAGKSPFTPQDLLRAAQNDPVLKGMKENYDGRKVLDSLAIKKIKKKDSTFYSDGSKLVGHFDDMGRDADASTDKKLSQILELLKQDTTNGK